MATKFSPTVQKLVNNAKRVAPPARRTRRLFDRCTTVHDGQRITFDLTTAKSCPPGFFGLKNGGGVRVAKIEKVASSSVTKAAPRKARAKAAPKPRKKAAKKKVAKKKNGNGNGNGNGHTMTVASVRERLAKLYKAKKVGEASKLRAKARKAGLAL